MANPAIATSGLTRHFGMVRAVDGIDLCVPSGSVFGFLGPNAAGKTTTIRMLLGLTRPDRGEIRLLGRPMTRATRRRALRRVGALVQTPSLYPHLSGTENLRVTQHLLDIDRAHIDRVLDIVALRRDAGRLVKTYSHGMRQRLGLAMALLAEPDLLILDEPTDGLDPAGIHDMRELIRGLPTDHGITVFLSSHLLAEVEHLATHVGIIGQGQLLFQGTLTEFRTRHRERAILEVDHPTQATDALRNAGFTGVTMDGSIVTVTLTSRAETAQIAAAVVHAGVSLYRLHTTSPSLEELFLHLTSATHLGSPLAQAEITP